MKTDTGNDHFESGDADLEIDAPEDRWWETASLSAMRAKFREALADAGPPFTDVSGPWLYYWVVANSHGLTRGAAKALALLIEITIKRGGALEDLTDPAPDMRVGYCRFFARALIALAEQPRIALTRLERLEHEITGFAARVGLGESDAAAIRLALSSPLGREPRSDDLQSLREFWERKQNERTKDADGRSAAYCDTALGQILVENLLLKGATEEALSIARKAIEKKPCMSGCALAPQGLLSLCLEPLRQAGDEALARSWERKLANVAPPGHTWIAPAGARIRFLAKTECREEALRLISDTEPSTTEPQTSAWQRFLYFRDAAVAMNALNQKQKAKSYRRRAEELALSFDQRNENQTVSGLLIVMGS